MTTRPPAPTDFAPRQPVSAVLGPTNTGKTRLAVERMLAHRTGVIGLPLRLLAREIYDTVAARVGARSVALVTGEERIVPESARYHVCTVEAMPRGQAFEFAAVDEVQLATDPERGHTFTDRLLNTRGIQETMFLGSDVMTGMIRELVGDCQIETRPRFSALDYAGPRKLQRLPRRSAIVAFSAQEVYALGELIRRHKGGAAIVLGALSPRTRNAQVELFQAGEVDYLVATDAIGMGLNMDVDHVAFAGLGKFDGRRFRPLMPIEIGQIAGRAGRFTRDGTWGVSEACEEPDEESLEAVAAHRFAAARRVQWRNARLDYQSLDLLIRALELEPPRRAFVRQSGAADLTALKALAAEPEIRRLVSDADTVKRLWDVCQIPDFRKTGPNHHHGLVRRIFSHLIEGDGWLPEDWFARQVERLDQTQGDIDALSMRIAQIRTWTYVANRAGWLRDAAHWRGRTRQIEDSLSDALHQALTGRFVDRRTAALYRALNARARLQTAVTDDGEVLVEGQYVGRVRGLAFEADRRAPRGEGRLVQKAAEQAAAQAVARRAGDLLQAPAGEIDWRDDNRLYWRGGALATLRPGAALLKPELALSTLPHLSGRDRDAVQRHLRLWLDREIGHQLSPLTRLQRGRWSGAAAGLVFQVAEGLGSVAREQVAQQIAGLDKAERYRLQKLGLRLGYVDVFMAGMIRPARARAALRLWAVAAEKPVPDLAHGPQTLADRQRDLPDGAIRAAGYRRAGRLLARIDLFDRLAAMAHGESEKGLFTPGVAATSLMGAGAEDLATLLGALRYRPHGSDAEGRPTYRFQPRRAKKGQGRTQARGQGDSPFAGLRHLLPQDAS